MSMFDIDRLSCLKATRMLKFILVLMLFILGPFFFSTTAIAETTEDNSQQTGSISGTVVDESGNPIKNANVFVYLVDNLQIRNSGWTDSNGNYSINNLNSGDYIVQIYAEGWIKQQRTDYVTVIASNNTSQINFTLRPGGSITGTVLDEQGKPITNARVCAVPVNESSIRTYYCVDDYGNYLINSLDSGDYIVEAKAEGWIIQQWAEHVTVNPPNKTGNINFTLKKGGSISGQVVDEQGQPIVKALVTISDNSSSYLCRTDDIGKYVFQSLISGTYEVNVRATGWIKQTYKNRVEVVAPNDISNINFTLQRGGSISGQVIDDSGNPINNANVNVYSIDDALITYFSNTDDLGNYIVSSMKSGEYRIQIRASGWITQEYSTNVIVYAPNDTSQINFTLHPEGSISGTISDEQETPITNADVLAVPVNGNSISSVNRSNTSGNYLITGLESGDYIVKVQAKGWIKQQRIEPVTVTASQKTENINFILKRGGSISGQVLDEQKQPVENAQVYVYDLDNSSYYYCYTDDNGNYIIQSLPSGTYKVNVNANGWIRQKYSNSVEVVVPNDTSNINFVLLRGGSISGRVVDNNGNPISNATVYATDIEGDSVGYLGNCDEIGYFKLDGLPGGNYQVKVQAKGWISQTFAENVNVLVLNDTGGTNFTLYPATLITNVSAISEDGKVKLVFNPPTGALGVIVVYKTGTGNYQIAVTETLNENSDSATVSGLTNGISYTFKLVVFGGVYEGESNEVTVTPTGEIDECFIATAAFGSKFEPAVVLLRAFRDQFLLTNALGKKFVQFYYLTSPPIANYIADNMILKYFVRALLIPIVGLVYLLYHPIYGFVLIVTWILIIGVWKKRWV